MSMSVAQRRTQVLERVDTPQGSVRLTKASSRYDRRRRYYALEFLPVSAVGHEHEDYAWRVVENWPVSSPGAGMLAHAAFVVATKLIRQQAPVYA